MSWEWLWKINKNDRMTEQNKFIPALLRQVAASWSQWAEAGGQAVALIKKKLNQAIKMKTNHLSTIAQKKEDGWGMRSWWMREQLDRVSRWTPWPSPFSRTTSANIRLPPDTLNHPPPYIPPTQLPPRVSLGEVTEVTVLRSRNNKMIDSAVHKFGLTDSFLHWTPL